MTRQDVATSSSVIMPRDVHCVFTFGDHWIAEAQEVVRGDESAIVIKISMIKFSTFR